MATASRLRLAISAIAALTLLAACGSSGTPRGADTSSVPAVALPTGAPPTGAPIVIGTVGGFSGYAGTFSADDVSALQAWTSYVNADGGIDGHPVQLIVKDDQSNPTAALADVKELVTQDHVVAIVGQHESGLEATWASFVSQQNVPVIGGAAASPDWLTNPDFYPTSQLREAGTVATMHTTVVAGKTKFALTYCAEVAGCAQSGPLFQSYAAKAGVDYVGAVAVATATPNYASQCLALKNMGAEVVFDATDLNTTKRLISDCARQGYKPIFLQNPQSWSSAETANPLWNGDYLTPDSASWLADNPEMNLYKAAMAKYQPNADIENTSATSGWVAAETLKAALEKSGVSATPTSTDVISGMHALGPDFSLGGNIPPTTYTPGKPAVQQNCGWYIKISNGQFTTPLGPGLVCLPS